MNLTCNIPHNPSPVTCLCFVGLTAEDVHNIAVSYCTELAVKGTEYIVCNLLVEYRVQRTMHVLYSVLLEIYIEDSVCCVYLTEFSVLGNV